MHGARVVDDHVAEAAPTTTWPGCGQRPPPSTGSPGLQRGGCISAKGGGSTTAKGRRPPGGPNAFHFRPPTGFAPKPRNGTAFCFTSRRFVSSRRKGAPTGAVPNE
jgi:hypothetical protein